MTKDTYSIIRKAIINREQVIATYDGYECEMCPHVLGTKNGRQQALFYQFGGGSKRGLRALRSTDNWRCIPIDGLQDVRTKKGKWHTAPHSRPQTCVDAVDVEVSG